MSFDEIDKQKSLKSERKNLKIKKLTRKIRKFINE